jgi:hypothetical protein
LERRLELAFAMVRCPDDEAAYKKWSVLLWQSARDAYDMVCPKNGPRAFRAFVLGRKKLLSQSNKNKKQSGGGDNG